jgi:hypothetical protein
MKRRFSCCGALLFAGLTTFLSAQQAIYVSSQGDSTIKTFTTAGGIGITIVGATTPIVGGGTVGGAPWGMALDASGNLYFANSSTHSILMYSATTHLVSTFATATIGGNPYPYGIAFDSSGNLFAAYPGANRIEKFSSAGVDLGLFASTTNPAYNIVFSPTGQLLLADMNANSIVSYATNGTPTTFITTHLGTPQGMGFDASGNLYVANQSGNNVTEFNSAGSFLGTFATVNTARDLAFDASGYMYAIVGNVYTLDKFAANGTSLGVFESPFSQPTFVIVSPIPEPAVTAAVAGIIVLLAMLIRRSRRMHAEGCASGG